MSKDINRLKVVLAEKKRTNKWLAEQLGKDPATVSKWCTNTIQPNVDLPADNVSYKCSACDEYIKTNCFTFLMMLYKTAVLPKEQLRNSYPIYNDEVMTKCIKCILFVLNRFYVS